MEKLLLFKATTNERSSRQFEMANRSCFWVKAANQFTDIMMGRDRLSAIGIAKWRGFPCCGGIRKYYTIPGCLAGSRGFQDIGTMYKVNWGMGGQGKRGTEMKSVLGFQKISIYLISIPYSNLFTKPPSINTVIYDIFYRLCMTYVFLFNEPFRYWIF